MPQQLHILPQGSCYEQHSAINERLGRIEETLSRFDKQLFGNGQPGALEKHDTRIKALEMWRSAIAGVLAFLVAVAGLLASVRK